MTTSLKNIIILLTFTLSSNIILIGQKAANTIKPPLDGFYNRNLHKEKDILSYDHIHEKDVFWEKRYWRFIDVKEKKNHIFMNPQAPFVKILMDAAHMGEITLYHVYNDKFRMAMSPSEANNIGVSVDTICTFDPADPDPEIIAGGYRLVDNEGNVLDSARLRTYYENDCAPFFKEFNYEEIKGFRLKEVYFFDEETSKIQVRILGIAPIINRFDDNGSLLNSGPMFWAYYPEVRRLLAQEEVVNTHNDASSITWEDVFEARMFSSYIIKASNLQDKRIKDYKSEPMSALLESNKIKQELFSFEQGLWSY